MLAYIALVGDFNDGLTVGLGIAFVYAASMCFNRDRSGGNINFANKLGLAIATRKFSNLFTYFIGPLLGAVIAVCTWYLYSNKFFSFFNPCKEKLEEEALVATEVPHFAHHHVSEEL